MATLEELAQRIAAGITAVRSDVEVAVSDIATAKEDLNAVKTTVLSMRDELAAALAANQPPRLQMIIDSLTASAEGLDTVHSNLTGTHTTLADVDAGLKSIEVPAAPPAPAPPPVVPPPVVPPAGETT